jgi:transcription elongation factor B subunit 1
MESSGDFVAAPLPQGKVRLISGDGFEFIVDDQAARVSTTIRGMLDSEGELRPCGVKCGGSHPGVVRRCPLTARRHRSVRHPCAGNFQETESRTVHLAEIPARVLEKCCQYFYFKLRYANTPAKSVPEFKVPPEMALELLMASNYLDA